MRKYILILLCHLVASALMASPADARLFGHVSDKTTGEHLPHITLLVKGTSIATVTDADGNYELRNLPAGNMTLEARFVGYKTGSQHAACLLLWSVSSMWRLLTRQMPARSPKDWVSCQDSG